MFIPKLLFQINNYNIPSYVIKQNQCHVIDWKYYFFNETEMITYIENNPIKEFENSVNFFKNIESDIIKFDFFKYYFLYLNGGVFLHSNATLEYDMDIVIENNSFIFVISSIDKKNICNSFMATDKNNIIIYKCLQYMYNLGFEVINTLYNTNNFNLNSYIYNTINDIIHDIRNPYVKMNNYKLLKEYLQDDVLCIIDNRLNNISKYYFKSKVIPSYLPIDKLNSKIKIGITLDIPEDYNGFFSNGLRLNVLFFAELLLNIGYDVYFIVKKIQIDKLKNYVNYKNAFYDTRFNIISENVIFTFGFDIIFIMGYSLEDFILKTLKIMKVKLILYVCGYEYVIDYNNFEKNDTFPTFRHQKNLFPIFDQVWCIPQQTYMNQYYLQTYYRSEVIEVPFIWCHHFLTNYEKNILNKSLLYKKKENNKKIAIFEPNLNIQKWFLPAFLVCENTYRILEHKENIKHIYITNVVPTLNVLKIETLLGNLDLFNDKIISVENRFNTLEFMKENADIAVSHQWELNLNYLYLDLAWWGWPIVHNANLCKDVGYYYEGFNFEMGGKVLKDVISDHDDHIEEYILNNRKAIDRYLPSNIDLQNSYKTLIEKLYETK
jgi:hypothetical protein